MKPTLPEPEDPGFWQQVFHWLTGASQGWEKIAKWCLIGALAIGALLWAVGFFLGKLLTFLEFLKNHGFRFNLKARDKEHIRKRKQFCDVINADLSVLAKTENWNDQYFTDLEAEVEAQGDYYPTALHKIFRRKSRGLRRVPSLIEAIETSTEQALLLVGEPGSGKSVALRHLAHQLASRGKRSSDLDAKIPLYVNLKEFRASSQPPTADSIKSFVLDNIRRGDSDTVAYVRENWDLFKLRGVWFFLFDSFDEIPAVLHAPTGSSVIRDHAEAIRQFLEGLGGCRGVLASREYKGPETLPWQKLRILSLRESRQDLLIDNSFLENDQKEVVRRHLAASSSSLGNNPMFLTLLCRYVKEFRRAPSNDHDLLSGHLELLSSRDSDYIDRKYGLSSGDLMQGAVQLAVLFAVTPELSLAPRLVEIESALARQNITTIDLPNTLAALVDAKILRSDVREAKPGDQRFTFSHRRYQETLFVRYLADNQSYLSPLVLLTDSRWREYAVTLLQTQPQEVIAPLQEEACRLLKSYVAIQPRIEVDQFLGGGLEYYDWDVDACAPLLGLLQEGLARRLTSVTAQLSGRIASILQVRWERGDIHDRFMVLKLGGLLPQPLLREYLLAAINSSSQNMRDIAFQQSPFIAEMPEGLADWVRLRLSDRLLAASSRADLLNLEALAARLPSSLGASFVLRRCSFLKRFVKILSASWIAPSGTQPPRFIPAHFIYYSLVAFFLVLPVAAFIHAMMSKYLTEFKMLSHLPDWASAAAVLIILGLVFGGLFYLGILYVFRSAGERLSIKLVVRGLRRFREQVQIALQFCAAVTVFSIVMVLIPYKVGPILGAGSLIILAISFIWIWRDEVRSRRRLRACLEAGESRLTLLVRATSVNEVLSWLRRTKKTGSFGLTASDIRSLMRLLLAINEQGFHPPLDYPLFQDAKSIKSVHSFSRLERRLERVLETSAQSV